MNRTVRAVMRVASTGSANDPTEGPPPATLSHLCRLVTSGSPASAPSSGHTVDQEGHQYGLDGRSPAKKDQNGRSIKP